MDAMVVCSLNNSRESDIITIRNGKNESSTFAATEKAYTCTSVCIQYRKVGAQRARQRVACLQS